MGNDDKKKKKIISFKKYVAAKKKEDETYHTFYLGNLRRDSEQTKRLKKLTEGAPAKKTVKRFWPPIMSHMQSVTPKPKLAAVDAAPEHPLTSHYSYQMYSDHGKALRNFTSGSFNMNAHLIHEHIKKHGTPEEMEHFNKKFKTWRDFYSSPSDIDEYKNQVATTSAALKTHKTPRDFHVFSGAPLSPERIKQVGGVKRIHLPAFTSTSIHPYVGGSFASEPSHFESHHIYYRDHFHPETGSRLATPEERSLHKQYMGHVNSGNWDARKAIVDKHPDIVHVHTYGHLTHIHIPEGSHGAYVGHLSNYDSEKEFILHHDARLHVHPKPTVDHAARKVIWHAKLVHDGVQPTRFANEKF